MPGCNENPLIIQQTLVGCAPTPWNPLPPNPDIVGEAGRSLIFSLFQEKEPRWGLCEHSGTEEGVDKIHSLWA